jgi:glutamine synthetase
VKTVERKERPEFIRTLFTSILGKTYSIEVASDRIDELFSEGICFDGSSVPGYANVNSSDLVLHPVVKEPVPALWDPSMSIVPCAVHETSGDAHPCDPMNILGKVTRDVRKMGYELMAGFELEFFLVRSDDGHIVPSDAGGYFSTAPNDRGSTIRREALRALAHMGIQTTAHHHEVAKGQHEIGVRHDHAEKAALSLMLAKHAISEIAFKEGLTATFMPKPFVGMNGSGMHIHQSLWTEDMKMNTFSSGLPSGVSPVAERYIAGILSHASALSAIVAPTVNSFKRLVPGFEAPTRIAWGPKNRTTMIRVPHFNGSSSSARIEFRCPDPSCSPHLALAAILALGIHGVQSRLVPPEPTSKDLFHESTSVESLPSSLGAALDMLEQDSVIQSMLGSTAVHEFLELKRSECDRYRLSEESLDGTKISKWEIEEYLTAS